MMVNNPKVFLLLVGIVSTLATTAYADPTALTPSEMPRDDGLSIVYSPDSGRVTATAPEGLGLTALQLISDAGIFTQTCENLPGGFDLCKADRVFKLVTGGFENVDLGPILPAGLDGDELLIDLKVDGASEVGGFDVGEGAFLVHSDFALPEPSSALMLCSGLLLLVSSLRKRRQS